MKSISIPAQITTVEDRIAGNLTLTQLSLLAAPIFLDFALYAGFPRLMHLSLYKLMLIILVSSIFFTLALRLKGKLVLFWAITIISFALRNKLYVFNKNSLYLRQNSKSNELEPQSPKSSTPIKSTPVALLNNFEARANLTQLDLNLSFKSEKKGRLHVYVSES